MQSITRGRVRKYAFDWRTAGPGGPPREPSEVETEDASTGYFRSPEDTRDVWGVAVTADGRRAVSASDDSTLRVWDARATGALPRRPSKGTPARSTAWR